MLFVNGKPVTAERLNPLPRYAELVPDVSTSEKYEYIFNAYGTYAGIFDYPKSTKMIGQLAGGGGQARTNVLYGYGKNILWNAGRQDDEVIEYSVPDNKVLKKVSLDYSYRASPAKK
jgi:hypothetical protein